MLIHLMLHCGKLSDGVPTLQDWRNAYSLACVLRVAAFLDPSTLQTRTSSPRSTPSNPVAHASSTIQSSPSHLVDHLPGAIAHTVHPERPTGGHEHMGDSHGAWPEKATLARALLHLDMAAMMGGPAFRPQVDACIEAVQAMLQACSHPPGSRLQPTHARPPELHRRITSASLPGLLSLLGGTSMGPSLPERELHHPPSKVSIAPVAHAEQPPASQVPVLSDTISFGNDSADRSNLSGDISGQAECHVSGMIDTLATRDKGLRPLWV